MDALKLEKLIKHECPLCFHDAEEYGQFMHELYSWIRNKAVELSLGDFTLEVNGSSATLWSEHPKKTWDSSMTNQT